MSDAYVREAYDSRAAEYIELFGDDSQMAEPDRNLMGRWRDSTSGLLLDVRGTLRKLPTPSASLGGILAWYSLIHASPNTVPAILDEFARCLEPSGGLLIGFFDGEAEEEFPHAVAPAYFMRARLDR